MKRKLTQKLIDWKNRPNHKPLILQGARQVGKTYILEEFGRNHYKNYIKVIPQGQYQPYRDYRLSGILVQSTHLAPRNTGYLG